MRYLDGEDGPADSEQPLISVPPDPAKPENGQSPTAVPDAPTPEKEPVRENRAPAEQKKAEPKPEKRSAESKKPVSEEDEDWGIQPDLGF